MSTNELTVAHRHSIRHEQELRQSTTCGCFYCCRVYTPAQIEDWIDDGDISGRSALCPYCGTDSVIGSSSQSPITEEFLRRMYRYFF